MGKPYRSWAERRDIINAMIADSAAKPLSEFALTESEEVFFRARAARAVDQATAATSDFKSYYALPTAKPFRYVLVPAAVTAVIAVVLGLYLWASSTQAPYPLLAACATTLVVAAGWAVAGWITHRNTVRQNTNNILFARFSQATFGEALHRFHMKFGHAETRLIQRTELTELRNSENDEDRRYAGSVIYILNYYEFISSGVINGDLDKKIVEDNIRSLICYYHDKCLPIISSGNKENPKVFANLIKMRTHYRRT